MTDTRLKLLYSNPKLFFENGWDIKAKITAKQERIAQWQQMAESMLARS